MAKKSSRRRQKSRPEVAAQQASPTSKPAEFNSTFQRSVLLKAALIILAGFWIYWPALRGDWLWDDFTLIRNNAVVQAPDGLWKIWFEPSLLRDYFPLKVTVEWIEWHLWGDHTIGYHLVDLILHLTGALLLWRLLTRFGLRWAWLGGLIFAIHPVLVESVAWIAELKNTLSLPPFILAMLFWIDYEDRQRARDYLAALGLFLAAMLCKTSMVTFPVVILLYAWWKRGRVGWKDFLSSIPFFAVSLVLGLVTIIFLAHRVVPQEVIPIGGIGSRLARAGLSIAFYFSKCVLPINLMTFYPRWNVDPPSPIQFLPWPILFGVFYWLWTKRKTWGRHALLGLGFFLISLLPFVGLTAGSYMQYTWVMDHLLYIPIIGLVGLAVAGIESLNQRLSPPLRPFCQGCFAIVMVLFAVESRSYAATYINIKTYWTNAIEHNRDAWPARNDLALMLLQNGRYAEAIVQSEEAFQSSSIDIEAVIVCGVASQAAGDLPRAISYYQQFRKIAPQDPNADYVALWLWTIHTSQGGNADRELSDSTQWNAPPEAWVSHTRRFLLEQMSEDDYLASAASPDPTLDQDQHCEAWYYVGVKRRLAGDKSGAADAFRACIATGKVDFYEYALAQAELNQLKGGDLRTP